MGKVKFAATSYGVEADSHAPARPGFLLTPSSRRKAPAKAEGFSDRSPSEGVLASLIGGRET